MKLEKCYLCINFDDLLDTTGTSPTMLQNKKIKLESLHFNLKSWTWKCEPKPLTLNLKKKTLKP